MIVQLNYYILRFGELANFKLTFILHVEIKNWRLSVISIPTSINIGIVTQLR